MKKLLLIMLLFSTPAFAGISVCHTGETVTRTALRGNVLPGCEYVTDGAEYTNSKSLIKTVPMKYLKWTTQLEEMNQGEKDAVDQAIATSQDTALRTNATAEYDGQTTQGQVLRAVVDLTIDENNLQSERINEIIQCISSANNFGDVQSCVSALSILPLRNLSQAKTAIKNAINNGDVDE